jgi:hypothetical protein
MWSSAFGHQPSACFAQAELRQGPRRLLEVDSALEQLQGLVILALLAELDALPHQGAGVLRARGCGADHDGQKCAAD